MRTLYGLCVSSGNCVGNAHIVESRRDYSSAYDWKEKTIIIVKALDRDMLVNLNPEVVGVVAETGNIGSHAAGILRQLKIPCVLRINNALNIIKEGTETVIDGKNNQIILVESNVGSEGLSSHHEYGYDYLRIAKPNFSIRDIRTHQRPVIPRPRRHYQKLRYDIIEGIRGEAPSFLFGLPRGSYEQDASGSIIEYNSPVYDDICSFMLANPDWLETKARERSHMISGFFSRLKELEVCIYANQISSLEVFNECAEMYRMLYKYALMSQAISDDLLDYYIDFCSYVTGMLYVDDVLSLRSDYVKRDLEGDPDPGVSQTWREDRAVPHIWTGKLSFEPIKVNCIIQQCISEREDESRAQLEHDYASFRRIVPLVYELSEEFFFTSSSINSFINWSIKDLSCSIQIKHPGFTIEQAYNTSLENFLSLVKDSIQ